MPLILPEGTNLDRITWVTNSKVKPDRVIICPVCLGVIEFNAEEILVRKATGLSTSTPCHPREGEAEHFHPGFPPEPWLTIPEDGQLTVMNA